MIAWNNSSFFSLVISFHIANCLSSGKSKVPAFMFMLYFGKSAKAGIAEYAHNLITVFFESQSFLVCVFGSLAHRG